MLNNILKRTLCAITALAVLATIQNIIFADETGGQNDLPPVVGEILDKTDYQAIMNYDFNNLDSSLTPQDFFDEVVGSASMIFRDDNAEHGTYLSGNTTGSYWLIKKFDEPLENAQYLLSFDVSRSAKEGLFYTRFFLSESTERTAENLANSFVMNTSKIGYYTSTGGWGVKGIDYDVNKWNRVNIWIDTKTGSATYVVNNEVVGTSMMNDKLYALTFIIQSSDGVTMTDLDNISMYKVEPDMAKSLKNAGIYVPEELTYTVETEISSVHSGNIFTSFDEAVIDVKNTNKISEPIEFNAVYSVENYRGDVVWRSENAVKLEANETVTEKVHPIVDRYDIYRFKTEYIPKDENYSVMYNDAEFSIVNAPTPGYKNYDFGTCIHISKGRTKWDKIKYAIDTLGVGRLRDDWGWGNIEPQKGVYRLFTPAMETFVTEAAEMGIKPNLILNMFNKEYGMEWSGSRTPSTDEQLEAMAKAYEWFAENTKGIVDTFECGNELNFERNLDNIWPKHAKAQATAYNALKKGNPDCFVLTNGISRIDADWVERMMEYGGTNIFDGIAIHAYQGQGNPEEAMWHESIEPMRDMMAKNGISNKELWNTEANTAAHYSYFTPIQHGVNLVHQMAFCDAYNTFDKYFLYQIQTDESNDADTESWFGILHGQNVKNAYGAKPAYLMMANYIAQTENAEYADDLREDNIYGFRFKMPDGSYTAVLYTAVGMQPFSIDLGANSATIADSYGNEKTVKSSDGKYTFSLGTEPIYVKWSGDKFEKCDDKYELSSILQEGAEGDSRVYEFAVGDDAEISVDCPDNLKYDIQKSNGKVMLKVTADKNPVPDKIELADYMKTTNVCGVDYTYLDQEYGEGFYRDYINVSIKEGSDNEYITLGFEYVKYDADIEATLIPYSDTDTKHWKMKVKVKNNRTDKDLKGKLNITEPSDINKKSIDVNVAAGKTEIYYINIPSSITKSGYHNYNGKLITDENKEIPFAVGDTPRSYGYKENGKIQLKTLKRAKNETTVDGVLNEDEWKDYQVCTFDKSQVSYGSTHTEIFGVVEGNTFGQDADYGGKADFSGNIYAKWDEDFLYLAALVYDDIHWQKQHSMRFYYDDFFYINIKPTGTQRHDTRLEFALTDFYRDDKGRININWTQNKWVIHDQIKQSEDGAQASVVRKENVTIYEARVPWNLIVTEKTLEDRNFSLSFGIRDYDGDRDKTFSYGGWYCLVK